MKTRARFASALRKAADKIDPSTKAKEDDKIGIVLKPVDINLLDGFESPRPAVPVPDCGWNRSGWGNYL